MPTTSNHTPDLLRPDETAKMLRISKAGLYRLIHKRAIRFYKIMGSLRFEKGDIVSFLKTNRVDVIGSDTYGSTKN